MRSKIGFDKFYVAGHLGDAVDQRRRAEPRRLAGVDDQWLKGTRYRWLTTENMDEERWEQSPIPEDPHLDPSDTPPWSSVVRNGKPLLLRVDPERKRHEPFA